MRLSLCLQLHLHNFAALEARSALLLQKYRWLSKLQTKHWPCNAVGLTCTASSLWIYLQVNILDGSDSTFSGDHKLTSDCFVMIFLLSLHGVSYGFLFTWSKGHVSTFIKMVVTILLGNMTGQSKLSMYGSVWTIVTEDDSFWSMKCSNLMSPTQGPGLRQCHKEIFGERCCRIEVLIRYEVLILINLNKDVLGFEIYNWKPTKHWVLFRIPSFLSSASSVKS